MELEIIAIVGPTASGKTRRAVQIARRYDGEIISGDSRQIYRGMTIGTGKDLDEYGEIPYHLIDICEAGEKYNLHRFLSDFTHSFSDIRRRGHLPVLCGGTGMYVENALAGIKTPSVDPDPDLRKSLEGKSLEQLTQILSTYKNLHNTTDIDTRKRAVRAIEICEYYRLHPEEESLTRRETAKPLDAVVIGLDIPREERRKSISRRLQARLDEGMVKEIENLLEGGLAPEDLIYYGLEYKYLTLFVIGKISFEEMKHDLEIAIHQFAKRQMTWFRGMEKRGIPINWLPYDLPEDDFISRVDNIVKAHVSSRR